MQDQQFAGSKAVDDAEPTSTPVKEDPVPEFPEPGPVFVFTDSGFGRAGRYTKDPWTDADAEEL